jgi:hypothetical protein
MGVALYTKRDANADCLRNVADEQLFKDSFSMYARVQITLDKISTFNAQSEFCLDGNL